MKVPEEVKVAAKSLIDKFGCRFRHLGERDGADFYMFIFAGEDDLSIGYPFVFKYSSGEVSKITGPESIDIINSFRRKVSKKNSLASRHIAEFVS